MAEKRNLWYKFAFMRFARGILVAGGIFNTVMGLFFFNNFLMESFIRLALWLEETVFRHQALLLMPQNPVHLLLIHGFGAAALILGATLIYSSQDPVRYLPFIFLDGLGRLLYGSLMLNYFFGFSLMRLILVFGIIELTFALLYLRLSWKLSEH